MVAVSITKHPVWPKLKELMWLRGHRVEIWDPLDAELVKRFTDARVTCAGCYLPIHPVRRNSYGLYLAVTCPLHEHVACARSAGARIEVARVKRELFK